MRSEMESDILRVLVTEEELRALVRGASCFSRPALSPRTTPRI